MKEKGIKRTLKCFMCNEVRHFTVECPKINTVRTRRETKKIIKEVMFEDKKGWRIQGRALTKQMH